MLFVDALILLCLGICLAAWWMPRLPGRMAILGLCASAILAGSIVGIFNYRAQHVLALCSSFVFLFGVLVPFARTRISTGIPWRSGTIVALLVLMSAAPIYLFPIKDLPAPSGKYLVGTRYFELVDDTRLGVLGAGKREPRRLLVRVWYPAEDVGSTKKRRYLTKPEVDHTIASMGEQMGSSYFLQYLRHVATHSYTDVPLLKDAKDLPVVVYSHGFGMFASQNSSLMEELASHGYVVYSIQHTYNGVGTVFPNGDVVDLDPDLIAYMNSTEASKISDAQIKSLAGKTLDERLSGTTTYLENARDGESIVISSASIWLEDRQFVMDCLENGEVPLSVADIADASSMARTGQMGMSFGGSTAGGICMVDSRCAAGVNLDGGDLHYTPLLNNIPVPLLMMYSDPRLLLRGISDVEIRPGQGFNDFSYERPELAGLRTDVHRLFVKNSTHIAFSDFPYFFRDPIKKIYTGSIDSKRMLEIQRDFVRGFFDSYLLGKNNGFPDFYTDLHNEDVVVDSVEDVRKWWLSLHPEDNTTRVVLETERGDIQIALYPNRSPDAVEAFIGYVKSGRLTGFYSTSSSSYYDEHGIRIADADISICRKGVSDDADPMGATDFSTPYSHFRFIGDSNSENPIGVLSFSRARSEDPEVDIFISTRDSWMNNPVESGAGKELPCKQPFGRVLSGLRILEGRGMAGPGQARDAETGVSIPIVKARVLAD